MNEVLQIYHSVVYCILFLFAGAVIVGYGYLLYKKIVSKCQVLLRTMPKSTLLVMLFFLTVATIHAQKRVYVDSSVETAGDGSKDAPYKEICEAFGEMSSSTSRLNIAIAPGVYSPFNFSEVPLDANGDPLSISITTYQRDGEECENAQWIIDGRGNDYAAHSPYCEATTNTITGVTVKNAVKGIGNFRVKHCTVSDCGEAALVGCRAENSEILNSGIGLDGGYAISCTFTGCTNIVIKDAVAEFCYVTNNAAIGVLNGTIDTCLVEGNDYGATNATIFASSILSNRKGGVLGESLAYNTLVAYNMDGNGRLSNFNIDTVVMTNCCTAPMPLHGSNNFYSAMPIYPSTYKLPIESPVFRNGSTNFLNFTADLHGKNRRKDGVTDIGAFFYTNSPMDRVIVPDEWYRPMFIELMDAHIEVEGGNYSYKIPNSSSSIPYKREFLWYQWEEKRSRSVVLVSIVPWPEELLGFDYAAQYVNNGKYAHFFYYDSILSTKSGKIAPDGTELTWWHEYILGTDPRKVDQYFRLYISLDADNIPQVYWEPNLGEERVYLIFGKKELSDEWVYIPDGNLAPYRFFKVAVDLP